MTSRPSASVLRKPSTRELTGLLRVERLCFIGDYAPHRFRRADFAAYLRAPLAMIRAAVTESEPVGYVAGVVRRVHGRPTARLDSIAVLPECRGQGIGAKLLTWFLNEARRHRCGQVTLEVAVSNDVGRAWFSRAGFQERRHLANYYGHRIDGAEMSLRLTTTSGE